MSTRTQPRRADQGNRKGLRYSICTLVTDHREYAEMVQSFRNGGFDGDCEYLYLDNSQGNRFDAFAGGNIFLREAAGEFIIMCHQDIVLLKDDRRALERRLSELDEIDPAWALCGNGGGTPAREIVIRVSDPHGENQAWGEFPARATSLDENFIVIRRDANLCLSHDLCGFHLYGADLCILADVVGRSAWIIDFHLRHKSSGRLDCKFWDAKSNLEGKYRRAFRARRIRTTVTELRVGGDSLRDLLIRLFKRGHRKS